MSGAPPAALAIGGAQAVAGGVQASARNRGLRRAAGSARESAQSEIDQTSRAAALQKLKRRQEAAAIRGRLRVLGSSAGTGVGGSVDATFRQADLDEALSLAVIDENRRNAIVRANSRLRAQLVGLDNQRQSVAASALGAGLSGFTTGLQLAQSFEQLDQVNDPIPTPVDTSLTNLLDIPDEDQSVVNAALFG